MKRKREPSEKLKKSKTLKLGEPSATRMPTHLGSPISSKSHPSETPTLKLRQLSSSMPLHTSMYTPSKPTTSTSNPSESHHSNPPLPPLQPFNLTATTLPISKALLFNAPIPPPSSTPSSPPYYDISSNFDKPQPPDPQSPTLAQLQAHALSNLNPSKPKTSIPSPSEPQPDQPSESQPKQPSEPQTEPPNEFVYEPQTTQKSDSPTKTNPIPPETILPSSDLEPTLPTLEEAVALFAESSVEKLISLSANSKLSDNPFEVRIHWNRVIIWMPSEAFKLKGLSE
ncbi:uncharacterized protein LOC127130169 [Lathyrus oleraceus]|uniref:uncharacterized protein LOC127130169 n=1 Tax=Pisum sativum TaxID=3888 RepID=UPI0021CE0619|nr:uncharacterized protein LOC127130169 [Pisum sativum]